MTNEEAKKMLKAKLECLKNETSGINHDCNMRLCDGCSLNYEQGNMGEQKEALDMAIKALEQTKWIPTSEKPTEGKYLITGAYGKNRYVDIATFDGEDATDTYAWDSYSDEYKVNRREHKVIAYMPLPEPYNAESEDEE